MLNKKASEPQGKVNNSNTNAHKYAIQFDIHPEISYLNQELLNTIPKLIELFHNIPKDVRISQQSIDEGLDFCRIVFWVFSDSSDALKVFGIWFQSLFREAKVADTLEALVLHSLEDQEDVEVVLSDWTRVNALDTDIVKVIIKEKENNIDI